MANLLVASDGGLAQVASPFLRVRQDSQPSEPRREFRRSLQELERINMNDLSPFQVRESGGLSGVKRQNRLSREVLGIDDDFLSAPDNTPKRVEEPPHPEDEDDAASVAFGGSVTSTVPDRYGFIGGSQYTQDAERDLVNAAVIRRRESKWLQMMEHWDKYMNQKYKKVRERCRKGIPSSIRPRAWQYLCGGAHLKRQNEGLFEDLLAQPGDPKWLDDIGKDIHRQFPWHEMFADSDGHGQREMFKVLKAYTVLNPVEGYCQGQGPIAAVLVMHMPAEEAFWCLVAICERYLPGYYSPGLEAIQIDGDILIQLLKKVSPPVHRHLRKQELDPILFMTEWFMCIYARTLPWSSVLRVWDMFFCEGVKVLFRVGLVLLKYTFIRPKAMKECPTMYESIELLKHLPASVTDENALVVRMLKLPVAEDDMEKVHAKVVEMRNKKASATQR